MSVPIDRHADQHKALFSMCCVTNIVLLLSCIPTHAFQPLPPIIPPAFSAEFVEFTAPQTTPPPYENGQPSAPFLGSRGIVYYDWSTMSMYSQSLLLCYPLLCFYTFCMVEIRRDYCVNIFPSGNNFSCSFYNVKLSLANRSYLSTYGSCCLFRPSFRPPSPDFLRKSVQAVPAGELAWGVGNASWWSIPELLPPLGPFYYAFRNDESPQLYLGFSFPGVQGWVQQNFFNVTVGPPSRDVFVLPSGVSALHMPAALCDSVTATSIHPQLRVTHSINYLPFSACSKLDIPDCQ